jgi:hypothetical protein
MAQATAPILDFWQNEPNSGEIVSAIPIARTAFLPVPLLFPLYFQRQGRAGVCSACRSGWIDGRNIRIDHRWGGGDADNFRKYAAELVALGPDTLLGRGTGCRALSFQREVVTDHALKECYRHQPGDINGRFAV